MAAVELFQFLESPQFTEACQNILDWPDGIGAGNIKERYFGREKCAMLIGTTTPNIGVMSFERILPIPVVNNLIVASTVLLWRKTEHWVSDARKHYCDPSAFERFQWLSDKLEECDDPDERPDYEALKGWRPTRLTSEI